LAKTRLSWSCGNWSASGPLLLPPFWYEETRTSALSPSIPSLAAGFFAFASG
jgi:hypothetical protein